MYLQTHLTFNPVKATTYLHGLLHSTLSTIPSKKPSRCKYVSHPIFCWNFFSEKLGIWGRKHAWWNLEFWLRLQRSKNNFYAQRTSKWVSYYILFITSAGKKGIPNWKIEKKKKNAARFPSFSPSPKTGMSSAWLWRSNEVVFFWAVAIRCFLEVSRTKLIWGFWGLIFSSIRFSGFLYTENQHLSSVVSYHLTKRSWISSRKSAGDFRRASLCLAFCSAILSLHFFFCPCPSFCRCYTCSPERFISRGTLLLTFKIAHLLHFPFFFAHAKTLLSLFVLKLFSCFKRFFFFFFMNRVELLSNEVNTHTKTPHSTPKNVIKPD